METLSIPSTAARKLPAGHPAVYMQWQNLLFAHWPLRPEVLRPLIPANLEIDTFDNWAWIGIVPFHLTIRYRGMPFALSFPEVNVRTYVKHGDQTGVWFISLDAHSRLAVMAARNRYSLPYHFARMKMQTDTSSNNPCIRFESNRKCKQRGPAILQITYGPAGESFHTQPGTLEHFLTERYRLFTADRHGRIGIGEIDHAPWRLHLAEADFKVNSMLQPLGLAFPREKPLLHFSHQVNAVAWNVMWGTNR